MPENFQNGSAERTLKTACLLTLAFSAVEFIGGTIAHSLALIADAVHLLTDAGALGLAFFAAWIARQPATRKMSYGYHRVEILAALVNGVFLWTLALFVAREAFHRFQSASEINTPVMLGTAGAGLLFNLVIAFFLRRFVYKSLNVRSAFYHVLSDLLGSFGVILAALVIWKTGWLIADPMVSLVISLLIIWGGWQILRDVVSVLLEAAPKRLDIERLEKRLRSLEGVEEICDLHVWTISSGKESLSAHLGVRPGFDSKSLLARVTEILSKEFGIFHTTIQIEESSRKPHLPHHDHLAPGF